MTRLQEIEELELILQIALSSCEIMDEGLERHDRWKRICFMDSIDPYVHNAMDKIGGALRRLKKIKERIQSLEQQ